jgi:hypothetical protein
MRLDLNEIDPTGELSRAFAEMENRRVGTARQAMWQARDGWCIAYTTSRIVGGPYDGRFAVMAYKPVGKGARTGKANEWVRVYYRGFSTRKAARARAERLYDQHTR